MYYRRKVLLAMLEKSTESSLEKLSFQKLLFLFSSPNPTYFNFVPYKYGAYSFQANKDMTILSSFYKIVESSPKHWKLIDKISQYSSQIKQEDCDKLNQIMATFGTFNSKRLIQYTYKEYPYYAIHSKRKLHLEQQQIIDIAKKEIKKQKSRMLFSIGYEGISIDAYLNKLVQNNIALLCDVRKNPVSMKYGFSKNKLQQYCKELGIFYCHFPSFGIESAQRQNLQTPEDYQKLFFTYKTNLHNRKEEINELLSLLEKYNRIALTCFESDSHFCHRSVLIDNITSQYKIPVGFL